MKNVYICAPLGGDIEGNLKNALRYTRFALEQGVAPVTPHFYAECLDDNNPAERKIGRTAGLSLLLFCDEMWVFGETISAGMRAEIEQCKALNIRIRHIKEQQINFVLGGYQ